MNSDEEHPLSVPAPLPDTQEETDLDLDIVASSYRVINEPEAWADMVRSWDKKLSKLGYDNPAMPTEAALKRQYTGLKSLLARMALPTADDPINLAVRNLSEPAMVMSRSGRVMAVNERGRAAFGVEQGAIAPLDWLSPADHGRLQDLLRALGKTRTGAQETPLYQVLGTIGTDGLRGYAEVYEVNSAKVQEPLLAVRELATGWHEGAGSVLRRAFELSDAEIEICRLLYLYADLDQVAAQRGVSIRTARTQLSRIFAKTETGGQVALVRLLSHIGARLSGKQRALPLQWSDPLGREQILLREDGRRLAHTWLGDPNGRPALFLPGIVHGYLLPPVFEDVLKERGVKLHVLTRPGAGNSDADPSRPPDEDITSAIRFFCDHMGLQGIPAAGVHSINVPLIQIATSNENLFSEIIAVGRFLSIHGRDWQKVPPVPRAILWLNSHAKWAAEVVGQQGWRTLVRQGLDWYIDQAYGDMPFDIGYTRAPDISAMLRNACAYTFLQSHKPFFDDFTLRQIDVRPNLERLGVRLDWLIGAVDVYSPDYRPGVFYNPSEMQRIEASNDRIHVQRVEKAADLICYEQPRLIAERIADAVDRNA